MNQVLWDRLRTVEVLESQTAGCMQFFGLRWNCASAIRYRTLDEALAAETLEITETSEGGTVPLLKLLNRGDDPVFLMAGEQLVGAKQNRILKTGDAEIRISFQADPGSWSAVGTDALVESYFPKYQPTMNFGWLEDNSADAEYERVVAHEFGHALGCVHEHQSPDANLPWDQEAVYASFMGPPNYWTKEEIDFNILRRYSPAGVRFTRMDPDSIMLYMFPANLFRTGEGTKENTHLSQGDKQFIAQVYPRASSVPHASPPGHTGPNPKAIAPESPQPGAPLELW
jgi:hypothetical protein